MFSKMLRQTFPCVRTPRGTSVGVLLAFLAAGQGQNPKDLNQTVVTQLRSQYPAAVSISRDGSMILLKAIGWDSEKLSVIDRRTRAVISEVESKNVHLGMSWSPNGDEIAYLLAVGNGEDYRPFLWTIKSSNVKDLNGPATNTAFQSIRWSADSSRLAYLVGTNEEATIWAVDVRGQERPRSLTAHIRTQSDFEWSPDGRWIAAVLRNSPSVLQIIDASGGNVVGSIPVGRSPASDIRDLSWSPDSKTLALAARLDGDFRQLVKVDLQFHRLLTCSLQQDEISSPHFISQTRVIYSVTHNSEIHMYSTECRSAAPDAMWVRPGVVRFLKLISGSKLSGSHSESIGVLYTSPVEPPSIYAFQVGATKQDLVYRPASASARASNAGMISITSADGVPIQTVFWPRSGEAKPKDAGVVLVDVHGGPHLQQYRRWEVLASVMNEAGIDVISPNYRGSEGYGYRFERASDLQTQVKDIIAACKYARAMHGKSKVILMGTSYGALLAAAVGNSGEEDVAGVVLVSMIGRSAPAPPRVGWNRPLYGFHGENDIEPPEAARTVIESFLGAGSLRAKDSQWHVMSDEGHVFRLTRSWTEIYSSILNMRDRL